MSIEERVKRIEQYLHQNGGFDTSHDITNSADGLDNAENLADKLDGIIPYKKEVVSRRDGADGNYVVITSVTLCRDLPWPFNRTDCLPAIRDHATIHLGSGPAKNIANGTSAALALIAKFLGGPATPWLFLAAGLVKVGYEAFKNSDGSADIYLERARVRVGPAGGMVIHADPLTCSLALESIAM